MAAKKFDASNYIANGFGIPAHDFIKNTYDVNDNVIQVDYYSGGVQDSGELVASLVLTYDIKGNLETVESI